MDVFLVKAICESLDLGYQLKEVQLQCRRKAQGERLSGVCWAACFSQPTLLGINVGLTIEPLAQATATSTQALCLVCRF